MRKVFLSSLLFGVLAACASATSPASIPAVPTQTGFMPTAEAAATSIFTPSAAPSTETAPPDDFFMQTGITLPEPACTGLTPAQMEGPYYKPDTPERHSLYENGMPGRRLILVGYVLDQSCQPRPGSRLDFWQADADGEYDNAGYRLRGHQFTDPQGRYYLETILPGLYESRPIEHIHVKVLPEGGEELTTQLYFPARPVEGLTVTVEERGNHVVGYFNLVVPR